MADSAKTENLAQALSRGIEVLKIVTACPHPRTAAWIAEQAGLSKATTYRLLRTLEYHDLVIATEDGRYQAGPGLATLAAATQRSFRQLVAPALRELADDTGLTAFVAMQDEDECVTLLSVIPSEFATAVAQAPGSRHSINSGAPGKAILSVIPRSNWPDLPALRTDEGDGATEALAKEIDRVWRNGYAASRDEVLPGVSSIAVPLQVPGERPCALALLYTGDDKDVQALAATLSESASAIERRA